MKRKCLLAISIIGATFSALAQVQEQKLQPELESLIFPLQVQHAHGSSIVALPNGDILAVWYQGSGERKADDVRILGARLKKGSVSWSPPFLVADSPDLPDCNPVVFLNSANTLCLAWIAVLAHRWENSLLRFRTSTNCLGDSQVVWIK